MYWKIGLHGSGNGTYTHYGTYMNTLREHGIPRVVQAVDNAGLIYEAQVNPVPGDVLVFRFARKDGEELDRIPEDGETETYVGNPTYESIKKQERIAKLWPPELDRSKCWYIDVNEPSKESWNYEYLGKWALAGAQWALEHGANYLAWGWSAGTPEPDFWESPSVLEYLRLAAENPTRVGVSLHEYTLKTDGYMPDCYPHLIGRFEALHDVCDRHGIARPTIVIGEFGWGENAIDWAPEDAMLQMDFAQELYSHKNILGLCTWTLGKWNGSVVQDTIHLVNPLIDRAINYEGDEPMEPCNGLPREQYRRVMHVALSSHTTDAQRKEIYARAAAEGASVGPSADDGGVGDLADKTVMLWEIPVNEQEVFRAWYANYYPGTKVQFASLSDTTSPSGGAGYDSPVDPVVFGMWPSGWIDAVPFGLFYQYTNGTAYHEGADLNKNEPHWDADRLAPVYASEGGVVIFSGMGGGTWGSLIVIKSPHTGFGHVYHRYAHLAQRIPATGTTVQRGEQIGLVGNAEGQLAYHLHFGFAVTNILETNPQHWPGNNLTSVVENYIDPKHLILLSRPGYAWPAKQNAWIGKNVNFRCGPSTSYTVIEILQQGTPVTWLNKFGNYHLIQSGKKYGWVHQDFLAFSPPASEGTLTGIGLHASANDGMGLFSSLVISEYGKLKPQVVKFLSSHDPALIASVVGNNKGTIDTYIVRAYLSWSGSVTPAQFYDRTFPDVQRSVNAILGQGIDPAKIYIELHNEMNLAAEGMWLSWSSGQSCSNFFTEVFSRYKASIPNVKYGMGGLSPGGDIGGVRGDSKVFAQGMISHGIYNLMQANFIHVYTESNWEGPYEMSWVQWNLDNIPIPTWVTESSWHPPGPAGNRPVVPGNEYAAKLAELITKLDQTSVEGVTFFCASASNPEFRHECFVISSDPAKPYENGQSRGISVALREIKPLA